MKNIYLFGASDDCHEIETDYGASFESYGDILINGHRFCYAYDGDWGVWPENADALPEEWIVFPIRSNVAREARLKVCGGSALHIQVPDDTTVTFEDADPDDD